MKITADTITVTPGIWNPDPNQADPQARVMALTVTGAAPGRWEIANRGTGWYFHVRHNGHHVAMTDWNAWDDVKAAIAQESGPYTVSVMDGNPLTGRTLSDARVAAVRIQNSGRRARIFDADGVAVPLPRTPNRED